jgi:predicted ArsR family transcriptional regulator
MKVQEQARALGHPTRYAIFRRIADAGRPADIAELTAHVGLNHNAIRQHLAKLVDAGLVTETAVRGPGPGRPRLTYEVHPAADSRWGVMGPYERLTQLLTEVIRTGETPVEVGRRFGRRVAPVGSVGDDSVDCIVDAMARQGFDPKMRRRGRRVDIVLRACPFQTAALSDPDTVCGIHLGMAEGLAALTGGQIAVDELVRHDPRRANCRLRLHHD